MSRVSVIIPNYNHAAFLRQRIESVLAQTYANFEVILLDDASSDSSREILAGYRDNARVSALIENQFNSGSTFRQWERGMSRASGEYLWIAESDDVARPDLLATLCGILSAHPQVGVAYCKSLRIDEAGQAHGTIDRPMRALGRKPWQQTFIARGQAVIRQSLVKENIIPNASAVVFRKSLLSPATLRKAAEYTINGDWFIWTNLLMQSDLAYVSRALNACRFHVLKGSGRNIRNFNNIAELYRLREFQYSVLEFTAKERDKLNGDAFRLWMAQRRAFGLSLHSEETQRVLAEAQRIDPHIRTRLDTELIDKKWIARAGAYISGFPGRILRRPGN